MLKTSACASKRYIYFWTHSRHVMRDMRVIHDAFVSASACWSVSPPQRSPGPVSASASPAAGIIAGPSDCETRALESWTRLNDARQWNTQWNTQCKTLWDVTWITIIWSIWHVMWYPVYRWFSRSLPGTLASSRSLGRAKYLVMKGTAWWCTY